MKKHTKKFWKEHPNAKKPVTDTILDSIVAPHREPPEKTIKEIIRNAHGQYIKGQSGNPTGMPIGTPSPTRELHKRLREHPNELEAIIDAEIKLGRIGDMRAIEHIYDRTDGKVVEKHEIDLEMPITIRFVPAEQLLRTQVEEVVSAPEPLRLKEGGVEEGCKMVGEQV